MEAMLSSRRLKKGPGRRPLSAKRQKFMELLERGWSIRGAAREVGVSRSSGTNWTSGMKVIRNGVQVGFVPPLDRLQVRQIGARYLSQDERIRIADMRKAGLGVRQIAARLGRAPSTISRELRRKVFDGNGYAPFDAHQHAVLKRARHHRRRIETNSDLRQVVVDLLAQRWSPQQISRHLHAQFPDQPPMRLCHESIYQLLYQAGSAFMRPSVLAPRRRSPLRTGRDHRRAHHTAERRRPRFQQPMMSIHQRPFAFDDRSEAGHWEGDLIIGTNQGSAIGTLVERHTRMVILLHLPTRDGHALHSALQARLGELPPNLRRSITWDQGSEMARHVEITKSVGMPVYFCDSHSPWQRGSNENTNGLTRDYFPKGTDLNVHTAEHIRAVENELNRRPRQVLGNRSPFELFNALLTSENSPCCDVD